MCRTADCIFKRKNIDNLMQTRIEKMKKSDTFLGVGCLGKKWMVVMEPLYCDFNALYISWISASFLKNFSSSDRRMSTSDPDRIL